MRGYGQALGPKRLWWHLSAQLLSRWAAHKCHFSHFSAILTVDMAGRDHYFFGAPLFEKENLSPLKPGLGSAFGWLPTR
jgi:hypothetical protein